MVKGDVVRAGTCDEEFECFLLVGHRSCECYSWRGAEESYLNAWRAERSFLGCENEIAGTDELATSSCREVVH